MLLEIDPTDYELAVEETRRSLELEATRIGLGEHVPPGQGLRTGEDPGADAAALFDIHELPSVVRAKQQEDNARSASGAGQATPQAGLDQRRKSTTSGRPIMRSPRTTMIQAQWDAQAAWWRASSTGWCCCGSPCGNWPSPRSRCPRRRRATGCPQEVKYAVVERKVTEGEMVKDAPGSSTRHVRAGHGRGAQTATPRCRSGSSARSRKGQQAEVRVDAYPDKVFAGEVIRINPMIERTSRTFQVEVYVENPMRELKAGGFAKVDILTHVDPQAWTVPAEAVVSYAGSTKIFVVREGRAHAVPIATGVEGRGWVELVRSASPDLRPDDQVITSGQEKLAEGVPVSIRGK